MPPAHPFLRLRSSEACVFPIRSVNVHRLRIRVFEATNIPRVWLNFSPREENLPKQAPLIDKTIDISSEQDKPMSTNIDLSQLVKEGYRQLCILVEQVDHRGNRISSKPQQRL